VTNARAEALLDKQGIRYEREPDWIKKGQKPDFYCRGRTKFWCEVKTLGQLPDSKDQNRALAELRNRTSGISSPGYGIGYISSALSHRDAKTVTHLVRRAARRFEDQDAPQIAIAIVPSDAKRNSFVRFSISTKDHEAVEFHSCASVSGTYGVPLGMTPEPYDQNIELRFCSGLEKKLSAEDVIKTAEDFRVAVVIHPDDTPFEVVTIMTILSRVSRTMASSSMYVSPIRTATTKTIIPIRALQTGRRSSLTYSTLYWRRSAT
jgi:hypothetical protein